MVLGIHTYSFSDGNPQTLWGCIGIVIRQVLNCAVPLFLAISSFFLSKKDLNDRGNRITFWHHQIPKVYFPALFWGIPWFVLACIKGGGISFNDVLLWITCGFSVLYYVALIIQYYLLIPWLQKLPTRFLVVSSAVVSLISILLVTYLRSYRDVSIPIILYAGICPLWIVFYALGIALSRGKREYRLWPLIILLVISLVFSFGGRLFFRITKDYMLG